MRHVTVFVCIALDTEDGHATDSSCTKNLAALKSDQNPDWATLVDYVTMNQLFCNMNMQWGNIHAMPE